TRSIAEWTASVTIAIEPVTTPAASFRAINARFERMERRAAPVFADTCASASSLFARGEPIEEEAGRLPSVADLVLLIGGELGHSRLTSRTLGWDKDRVVAEPAAASGPIRQASRGPSLEEPLAAIGVDER